MSDFIEVKRVLKDGSSFRQIIRSSLVAAARDKLDGKCSIFFGIHHDSESIDVLDSIEDLLNSLEGE